MSGRLLQQLLRSGEYDEFEDIVMVEGEFIEFDHAGYAIRQVILGTTPSHLIKAIRNILDYKKEPDVFYDTTSDLDLDGLELVSIVPICLVNVAYTFNKHELEISVLGEQRLYLLCNTHINGHISETWERWRERVEYMHTDPYHYIRNMLDEHSLPYPDVFIKLEMREKLERRESDLINAKLANVKAHGVYNTKVMHIGEVGNACLKNVDDFSGEATMQNSEDSDHKIILSKNKMKRRKKGRILCWKFLYIKRRR